MTKEIEPQEEVETTSIAVQPDARQRRRVRRDTKLDAQFDALRISIANPDQIRSWSHGEIKKPETINYRTFRPERDGLFCARIFGPMKDYECLCGKYKRMKYKGIVCEKCGVEVALSKSRRERMGHIELAAPVAHIWFLKSLPSRLGLILDMTLKELEKVLYFERYVVVEAGMTGLKPKQLLTENEYIQSQIEYGSDSFSVMIGAEALETMLKDLNIEERTLELREEFEQCRSQIRKQKLVKKIKLLTSLFKAKIDPLWMILKVLPVISPDLRPLVPLDGGRFATSDLNDFYRRVINRNNRLKRLVELRAPSIIIRNEKRMLQEAVDALFDNGRREKPIVGTGKRPLKSLTDMLKGKQGRFRQNLLGKRVDYSGRSVIIVGPELKMHQCGLPKKMALELFMPFILAKLEHYEIANSIKAARKMVEQEHEKVWDVLEEVINEHPVLLNRAPTLHRLGVQAFEPILVDGKAIQLHPLSCAAFNADFDGDQMAVHVPLSLEAQLEARVLMMSTNNILSPANGKPIIAPSEDIILGLYYLTIENAKRSLGSEVSIPSIEVLSEALSNSHILIKTDKGDVISSSNEKSLPQIFENIQNNTYTVHRIPAFAKMSEIELALSNHVISTHSRIRAIYEKTTENNEISYIKVGTTPGRMMLAQILPKHPKIDISLINTTLTKKDIGKVIDTIYRHCGQKETILFCDSLKVLGFKWAANSGISFGKDDLLIPPDKASIIDITKDKVKAFDRQYQEGLITLQEKYNKVVDIWSKCTDNISDIMMKGMAERATDGSHNSVYMMAHSGARGSPAQIKQLAGMRGLMAKPSGEIIEQPIISNFKEGLNSLEYFNSTHGARKGLADTALKTANSGYLTRRLVDVSQDCVVVENDCCVEDGLEVKSAWDGETLIESLGERILGRVLAEDAVKPNNKEVILQKGSIVNEVDAKIIDQCEIESLKVRSVLTCKTRGGICSKCYGRDLARGTLVNKGEAVGVIAAQSIGEPGTQLTMRTFHIGGAVQGAGQTSSIIASVDGTLKLYSSDNTIRDREGLWVILNRHAEVTVVDDKKREKQRLKIPFGARMVKADGEVVKKGDTIASWDPYTIPIITECSGVAQYVDLEASVSYKDEINDDTGISNKTVVDWRNHQRGSSLKPAIVVGEQQGEIITLENNTLARYYLSMGAILSIDNGQEVKTGDIIARIPRESSRTKDITGGLPRVAELFEARAQKDPVIISEIDGRVVRGADNRRMQKIIIQPTNPEDEEKTYQLPKGLHVNVKEGEFVRKGDQLQQGNPSPHDILRIFGIPALADYFVKEVQEVYRLQGVRINDKHIEVIIRQMLQKIEVIEAGDSLLVIGEVVDKEDFEDINKELSDANKQCAVSRPILLGITKASLQTKSFISSASFQETSKVLTEAAVSGKVDNLVGLKENVIVGRLIPAGTGMYVRKLKKIAEQQLNKKEKITSDEDDSLEAESSKIVINTDQSEKGDNVGQI